MPDAAQLLALALQEFQARRLTASESLCRQFLELNPASADLRVHVLLGSVLAAQGRFAEACLSLRLAHEINPADRAIASNLALSLKHAGQLDQAIKVMQAAAQQHPDAAELHYNLGCLLLDVRRHQEASGRFRQALEIRPDFEAAAINLGQAYRDLGLFGEAIDVLQSARQIRPENARTLSNLAVVLHESGQVEEALTRLRQCLELNPADATAWSNYLYYLSYSPNANPSAVFAEHRRWNALLAAPLTANSPAHKNDRDPERKLKIGYVSANFCEHSVAFFLEPVLASHDRAQFEIVCFSNTQQCDAFTRKFQSLAGVWHDIRALSDDQAAACIREAGIDILVDLTVHTTGNRLLVFARKPAPVQISMLGYPQTTGLSTMDFRLGDVHLDPPALGDALNSERLLRMPRSYFCYRPPDDAPAFTPLPAIKSGQIRFGCFNTLAKFNILTAELWSRVLTNTPGSRLVMLARGLGDSRTRERVLGTLVTAGVDSKCVELLPPSPLQNYLRQLGELDIALDPIPFSSGTTTCHALWMGIPVVSLTGQSSVARMGASVLANAGFSELVAHTADEYVAIATGLAADREGLAGLRSSMRRRLLNSPLLDAAGYTRELESLYRQSWREWTTKTPDSDE
jgi:predicted O-linked N-acetylglucosamine transferase (SPINDLY family)